MEERDQNNFLTSIASILTTYLLFHLVLYIYRKCFRGEENIYEVSPFMEFLSEGSSYMHESNYFGALDSFEKCLMIAVDKNEKYLAHDGLARTYYAMTDYEEAINHCNKSLDLKKTTNYELRSMCFEGMKKYKEAVNDMLMHDHYRNDKDDERANAAVRKKIESLVEGYAKDKVVKHIRNKYLPPSQTNCKDFFDTFIDIIPKGESDEEDVAYYLEHHQYDKLYNFFLGEDADALKIKFKEKYKSNNLFTYEILLASIYYIMGDTEACSNVLINPKTDLEVIFKEIIKPPFQEIDEEFNKLNHKGIDNLTVKFWLAKAYRKAGRYKLYLEIMNNIKSDYYFFYCDLLAFYTKNNQEKEYKECEKEALHKFKDNSSVSLCVFDFYLKINNREKLEEIIKEMITSDSRSFMMRGQYFGLIGDINSQIDCYKQSIDRDNTFFTGYIYLAEYYKINDLEKFKDYLNQALKVASKIDDLFWCYKELIIEECKEKSKSGFP